MHYLRRAKISSVLAIINAVSALDSTFRRTTGSVLDVRRLKAPLRVFNTDTVRCVDVCGRRLILRPDARYRLCRIPQLAVDLPDAGNAAWRSATSDFSELFFRHSSSATSSHGIIPLSQ